MADFMSENELKACAAAERKAGFNRSKAEGDLHEVMRKLGIGSGIGPSAVPGVAVYLCDDMADEDRIKRELEKLGHKVEDVISTTWVVEDGTDEDVVAVAFDTTCLPDDWRETPASPAP